MADFMVFSTETTNIFPAANSKLGGQLVSEWNLRSRETVATPSKIKYMIGPSYVHSMDDFKVTAEYGGGVLNISSGRGIFNGHFVESLSTVAIDILEKNNALNADGKAVLSGDLSVGIRVYYSTTSTMADTIRVEKTDNTYMYEGIQVVVLPTSQVKLPIDTPNDSGKINMHLKLADFTFIDGAVSNIAENPRKIESIEAERVANIGDVISENFVKKDNLDPDKFYVYNTRDAKMDNWCEAMDSLIVWDKAPGSRRVDGVPTSLYNKYLQELGGADEAMFSTTADGRVVLRAPHKQIDGSSSIIPDKLIFLPNASYLTGTPGVVSSEYTKNVKALETKVNMLFKSGDFPLGKCLAYVEELDAKGGAFDKSALIADGKFPSDSEIAASNFGDYILVAQDHSLDNNEGTDTSVTMDDNTYYSADIINRTVPASTMYVVSYGKIASFDTPVAVPSGNNYYTNPTDRPNPPSGFDPDTMADIIVTEDVTATTIDAAYINRTFVNSYYVDSVRGIAPNKGYILIRQKIVDGDIVKYKDYYAKIKTVSKELFGPVFITDRTKFADIYKVGGFLNIDPNNDNSGQGYVYLDENGHLRVMDYTYLSQGILAYQLGADWSQDDVNSNVEAIQESLDNLVNERIAFRSNSISSGDSDVDIANNVINISIYLPQASPDEDSVINIHSIDSRFGGSVHLHIFSQKDSNGAPVALNRRNIINIIGCEKIRIDSNIPGEPTINIKDSNLYYDRNVFNALGDVSGLGIWYEKYSANDLDIQVDGMTVTLIAKPTSPEVFEFWRDKVATNDNHYIYALRSITFGSNGYVTGCSILFGDSSTSTTSPDSLVVYTSDIRLPQSMGFPYPERRMQLPMKVTGSFVSAYGQGQPIKSFIVRETEFSMLIGTYDESASDSPTDVGGQISLLTKSNKVSSIVGLTVTSTTDSNAPVCAWRPDSYHIFSGGLI